MHLTTLASRDLGFPNRASLTTEVEAWSLRRQPGVPKLLAFIIYDSHASGL